MATGFRTVMVIGVCMMGSECESRREDFARGGSGRAKQIPIYSGPDEESYCAPCWEKTMEEARAQRRTELNRKKKERARRPPADDDREDGDPGWDGSSGWGGSSTQGTQPTATQPTYSDRSGTWRLMAPRQPHPTQEGGPHSSRSGGSEVLEDKEGWRYSTDGQHAWRDPRGAEMQDAKAKGVCFGFQKGHCGYGTSCKFVHRESDRKWQTDRAQDSEEERRLDDRRFDGEGKKPSFEDQKWNESWHAKKFDDPHWENWHAKSVEDGEGTKRTTRGCRGGVKRQKGKMNQAFARGEMTAQAFAAQAS